MRFKVSSTKELLKRAHNVDALITVTDKHDTHTPKKILEAGICDEANWLHLAFDNSHKRQARPMSICDAKAIVSFVRDMTSQGIDCISIACPDGVSRSQSIAAFFELVLNGRIDRFTSVKASPDPHILRLLNRASDIQTGEILIMELVKLNQHISNEALAREKRCDIAHERSNAA